MQEWQGVFPKSSKEAWIKIKESGLLKKQRLAIAQAYCDAYNDLSFVKDDGITANELQEYIYQSNHKCLDFFDNRKISHINKHQAPLRRMNVINYQGMRTCRIKGGKARYDKLSFQTPIKLSPPINRVKIIKECYHILSQFYSLEFEGAHFEDEAHENEHLMFLEKRTNKILETIEEQNIGV